MQQIQETKMIALRESADQLRRLVKKYSKTPIVIKSEVIRINEIISQMEVNMKEKEIHPAEKQMEERHSRINTLQTNTNRESNRLKRRASEDQQSNHNVALKKIIVQSNPSKSVQEIMVEKTDQPAILSKEKEQSRNCNLLPVIREINTCKVEQLIVLDDDESQHDLMVEAMRIRDNMEFNMYPEIKYSIRDGFLDYDHKSTPKMRSTLINWMSEVHLDFKFLPLTFHRSVAFVDRYLQEDKNIDHETLQLVGTAAMYLAMSDGVNTNEESKRIDVSEFVNICDNSFSDTEIFSMVKNILSTLSCIYFLPLSLEFLNQCNIIAKANTPQHTLGEYLLELALFEYGICHVKPSLQAAAACCLSISILNELEPEQVWSEALVLCSTYNYTDIKDTMAELSAALVRAETSKLQAIRKKFASSQFSKISLNFKLKGALVQRLASQAKILKI